MKFPKLEDKIAICVICGATFPEKVDMKQINSILTTDQDIIKCICGGHYEIIKE